MKKEIYVVLMIFVLAETITAQKINECKTPNNQHGVCIPIKQCEKLNNLQKNKNHVSSVRIFLQKSFCGYDGPRTKYCCPFEKGSDQSTNKPTTSTEPSKLPDRSLTSSKSSTNEICGTVMIDNTNDRIVGGRPSTLGAWPWMAAIGYKSSYRRNTEMQWSCGGSLITNEHVLTAAHCVLNTRDLKPTVVRLGDLDLNPNVEDGATPLDILIERIITHERYLQNKKQINDIALLKLKNKVTFNDHIRPICLPSKSDMNVNYKKTPIVTGWGSNNPSRIYNESIPFNTKLMEVEIPLVYDAKCKTAYANETAVLIDNTVLCAGYLEGKKDSCRGDSGGPLILAKLSRYYLLGIVSFGPKECGTPGKPGVYTRVPSFIDWIQEKLE